MGPDMTNYELWFIDYLDGKLDEESCRLLSAFLEENPALKDELADIEEFHAVPSDVTYSHKEELKRDLTSISDYQFDLLCAASLENDLNQQQQNELDQIISSSAEKKRTYDLFNKLKVSPPGTVYKYKNRLRKPTALKKTIKLALIPLSAAAALTLILILLRPGKTPVIQNNTASVERQAERTGTETKPTVQGNQVIVNSREKKIEGDRDYNNVKPRPVVVKIAEAVKTAADSSGSEAMNFPKIEIEKIAFLDNGFSTDKNEARLAITDPVFIYNTFDEDDHGPGFFLENLFREKVFKMNGKKRPDAYDIADAGIRKINNFFGWNMSLRKNRNDKGEVRSVTFTSKLLTFDTPVKK